MVVLFWLIFNSITMFLPRKITFYISRKIQIKVTYVDPTSMYYTTTLLYLYSILRGEKEMLPANEAYSSPTILPSTYIYYPMLWAKGIVYIGKNVRESSNKQPTPYVLLLLLVQFACISFIPSLSLSLLKMSVIVFSILLLATRVIWEPQK